MNAVTKPDYIFFITPAHACSYLDGADARMVFLDPYHPMQHTDLSNLSRRGFRRSGTFVYKPECENCQQCISSRIRVADFVANSSQKRALKANQDLRVEMRPCSHATEVHYALFARYINMRHADGDMSPATPAGFDKFIVSSHEDSFFLEVWLADRLLGAAVCDPLDDGISAVYTFYEPTENKRSLGTFLILQQINYAITQQAAFVYLGYWVKDSPKMSYKTNFNALEVYHNASWQPWVAEAHIIA